MYLGKVNLKICLLSWWIFLRTRKNSVFGHIWSSQELHAWELVKAALKDDSSKRKSKWQFLQHKKSYCLFCNKDGDLKNFDLKNNDIRYERPQFVRLSMWQLGTQLCATAYIYLTYILEWVTSRWSRGRAKNQVSTNQNLRNSWCQIVRQSICCC